MCTRMLVVVLCVSVYIVFGVSLKNISKLMYKQERHPLLLKHAWCFLRSAIDSGQMLIGQNIILHSKPRDLFTQYGWQPNLRIVAI